MKINRLFDILYFQLENNPLENAFNMKVDGMWKNSSTECIVDQVNKVSRGLIKYGIKPGDKISIIVSNNRTEWLIINFAAQQIGAITVPIYPTLSEVDTAFVLNDSGSIFCFVSDKILNDKICNIKKDCPLLVSIFSFEEVEGTTHWSEVIAMGENPETQYEVESLKQIVKTEDLATIIYTSGTTGKPKGVMLSHKNIISNVMSCHERVPLKIEGECRTLSFLPISHVLELMINYIFIYRSYSIYFAESIEKLVENLNEVKPHVMTVVPRLIEKFYSAIYQKGTSAGILKTRIFLWAINLAEKYQPFKTKGLLHKIADFLVYKKWRKGLGGELIFMICGSASLSASLNRIFFAAGFPILEGYGLTETSPVIAVNGPSENHFKLGTVGPIIKNSIVKIAEDGEILTKGPNVFLGYYNNEEMTKNAFTEDGWLKTGDIGHMDDGFLVITDRKKEMFKTSGGKYITPQVIENNLKKSRFIEQAMVVGDGEKMPCALIQPDFAFLKEYIKYKNLNIDTKSSKKELIKNEILKKRIEQDVERVNTSLGHWEKIKKIELTPTIWSVEGGELTPTLKLKRKFIKQKYIDLYNKMYGR